MKRVSACLVLLFFVALLGPAPVFCVPAAPDAAEVAQPDGAVVRVYQKGDEWNNWVETQDGYTIEKGSDGYWRYVIRYENGKPVLSPVRADAPPPSGLRKYIRRAPDKSKTPGR